MTSPGLSPALKMELLKVLLQMAWSDHELSPLEVHGMHLVAERLGITMEDAVTFTHWVERKAPLPAPDLGALRKHRQEVLRAAVYVVGADRKLTPEEGQMLRELKILLRARR